MKQSDIFLASEGDAWHERNHDKPRLPDPVVKAMQTCQLQPKNVLELGCGNGWRLAEIAKIWKLEHHFGVDASSKAEAEKVANTWQNDILDALKHIGDARYDTIIFGFCLYLVDREDLMMIAAHTDKVLQDKGHVIIHDFYGYRPYRRPYEHKEGVWSYHQDYPALWLANPAYKKIIGNAVEIEVGVTILQKDIAAGWPERAE